MIKETNNSTVECRDCLFNAGAGSYFRYKQKGIRKVQFKVDRLQIILVAKKYISTCRNCSSVGCLKCVQFHNWFRLH